VSQASPLGLAIEPARAVLLVVDVQERLAQVMDPAMRASAERNLGILVAMAGRLRLPVVVSEQYKKGLGPTLPSVEAALAAAAAPAAPAAPAPAGLEVWRFEKLAFACTAAPEFAPVSAAMATAGRDQWIVTGMETHICVYQTVRGLAAAGARVQVVRDAVCSRTSESRDVGLDLCARAGAIVTTTETVVFDALGVAGSDDFKALSRLIK
jgi:isochorismate hydrolase